MKIELSNRIDSNNAAEVEESISKKLEGQTIDCLELVAEGLEYISSAGLRVILHLKKQFPNLKITGVSPEVYSIFEMTGFTEIFTVEKAYRVVSVEGCEEIGKGANGTIYRIDQDNVVKVYNNADALADIQHEREVAKLALVLGIPTAISYDVVKVGDSYGSVFELLNAKSFAKILAKEPDKFDWCVDEFVKMLHTIHGTLVPEGKLPDARETAIKWAEFTGEYLPKEAGDKLLRLIKEIPHDDHMIHGDYHAKNLELQGDEVLLIDMDTLAVGHPILELASMYNAFVGYMEYDHEVAIRFMGIDYELCRKFWRRSLETYLGSTDEKYVNDVEDKARIIGYTRMIRRSIRRNKQETEEGKAEIDIWTGELIELLNKTDSLLYDAVQTTGTDTARDPNELEIEAITDNLPVVQEFVENRLQAVDCSMKIQMQISIAVEEVFVNIAHYAYAPGKGMATVRVEVSDDRVATITFIDKGVPYNPLEKEDPDITLSAEERQIGGLGIFMTKKSMDDVIYEHKDGQNILSLKKSF